MSGNSDSERGVIILKLPTLSGPGYTAGQEQFYTVRQMLEMCLRELGLGPGDVECVQIYNYRLKRWVGFDRRRHGQYIERVHNDDPDPRDLAAYTRDYILVNLVLPDGSELGFLPFPRDPKSRDARTSKKIQRYRK